MVVDAEALRRGSVGQGERCEIPGVGPVGVEYARELLGEALVEVLIAKGTDVTTVYSAGRHVPKRIRSALLLRDPRCVVPNCDARLGLENDHWVTDFAQGGLTALDNLARLCRRHHLDRTHRGFELARTDEGWVWTAPEHPTEPKRQRPKRRRRARPTSGHRPTAVRPAPGPAPARPPGVIPAKSPLGSAPVLSCVRRQTAEREKAAHMFSTIVVGPTVPSPPTLQWRWRSRWLAGPVPSSTSSTWSRPRRPACRSPRSAHRSPSAGMRR